MRDGDRLSVDFHEAALGQVVEVLKRDARIVVRLPASLSDRKITVSFENLEIGAATDKLLMSASLKSSAVTYAPGLRGLITVVVVEAGTSKVKQHCRARRIRKPHRRQRQRWILQSRMTANR